MSVLFFSIVFLYGKVQFCSFVFWLRKSGTYFFPFLKGKELEDKKSVSKTFEKANEVRTEQILFFITGFITWEPGGHWVLHNAEDSGNSSGRVKWCAERD